MKNTVILMTIIALLSNCDRKKDKLSDSISLDILSLYSHNNPRLQEIASQKCDSDCQLLFSFAQKMRKTSEDLMIQSGGVNEEGKFIDPYRKGDIVLSILDKNDLHQSALDLVSQLNERDSLPNNLKKIKNIIDFTFSDDAGSLALKRVNQVPISFLCLELLVLENLTYAQLIDEK